MLDKLDETERLAREKRSHVRVLIEEALAAERGEDSGYDGIEEKEDIDIPEAPSGRSGSGASAPDIRVNREEGTDETT